MIFSVDHVFKDGIQVYVVKRGDKDIAICAAADDAMDIAHALNLYKSDVYLTKSEFYDGNHPLLPPDPDLLWECPDCGYQNRKVETRCRKCKNQGNAPSNIWTKPDPIQDKNTWECPTNGCGFINEDWQQTCPNCGTYKLLRL